ncbi:hypothetical protein [Sphingobium sp. WCS2017Hpa-17]|uniref:hypothetical protein n=1 Tax=Sphingobium sp. WCS2017Hpa-17 TaxID=3073638 RepID=UPI00288B6635|nr:hypothetical protein [Sphingobium sp. WCS2017Hpa-17]
MFELPVPGPKFLPALRAVAAAEPPLATHTDINGWVIKLSTAMAKRNMSDLDAKLTLSAYQDGLSDLAACDLAHACVHLLRTSRFMPTVAEIREAAAPLSAVRRYRQGRASMLILRHEREWVAPVDDDETVSAGALTAKALAAHPSKR